MRSHYSRNSYDQSILELSSKGTSLSLYVVDRDANNGLGTCADIGGRVRNQHVIIEYTTLQTVSVLTKKQKSICTRCSDYGFYNVVLAWLHTFSRISREVFGFGSNPT